MQSNAAYCTEQVRKTMGACVDWEESHVWEKARSEYENSRCEWAAPPTRSDESEQDFWRRVSCEQLSLLFVFAYIEQFDMIQSWNKPYLQVIRSSRR